MHDTAGQVIYVGKAKHLKNRLASYFNQGASQSQKTQALVAQIAQIELIVTPSEQDALLLENTLIKQHTPRYNVLLRDDKSYPYLYVSTKDEFPRLVMRRGRPNQPGQYFGPFISSRTVRETLDLLQQAFQLRDCRDSFFKNRSRACLQHQIKRCSAPCVGLIDQANYQRQVKQAIDFLQSKSFAIIDQLVSEMHTASDANAFEKAALLRDKISCLKVIQRQQHVIQHEGSYQVFSLIRLAQQACVVRMVIEGGHLIAQQVYQINTRHLVQSDADMLASAISQYWLQLNQASITALPQLCLTNLLPAGDKTLASMLSELLKTKIQIKLAKGKQLSWINIARDNALSHFQQSAADLNKYDQRLAELAKQIGFELNATIQLHCIDISHTMGKFTIGACVVFGASGPLTSRYRYHNLSLHQPGNDLEGIEQAVLTCYKNKPPPTVLVIDGGKAQIEAAVNALTLLKYDLSQQHLLGIAKGPKRAAEYDTIYHYQDGGVRPLSLSIDAQQLIQYLRDEAHRYAIRRHRHKRGKMSLASFLESIDGIGAKRRQALLNHFGSLGGIQAASTEEIAQLPGLSHALAKRIVELVAKQ